MVPDQPAMWTAGMMNEGEKGRRKRSLRTFWLVTPRLLLGTMAGSAKVVLESRAAAEKGDGVPRKALLRGLLGCLPGSSVSHALSAMHRTVGVQGTPGCLPGPSRQRASGRAMARDVPLAAGPSCCRMLPCARKRNPGQARRGCCGFPWAVGDGGKWSVCASSVAVGDGVAWESGAAVCGCTPTTNGAPVGRPSYTSSPRCLEQGMERGLPLLEANAAASTAGRLPPLVSTASSSF